MSGRAGRGSPKARIRGGHETELVGVVSEFGSGAGGRVFFIIMICFAILTYVRHTYPQKEKSEARANPGAGGNPKAEANLFYLIK